MNQTKEGVTQFESKDIKMICNFKNQNSHQTRLCIVLTNPLIMILMFPHLLKIYSEKITIEIYKYKI